MVWLITTSSMYPSDIILTGLYASLIVEYIANFTWTTNLAAQGPLNFVALTK